VAVSFGSLRHHVVNDTFLNLPSFAKINRSLRILGQRRDGYHEIVTVLQTVSLHDDLRFGSRNDDHISLQCDVPEIPTDSSNLIIRAALALRNYAEKPFGVDLRLIKRIPTKGGLGGASSNAAVTLLGLNNLWRTKLDYSELMKIGVELGADVPFFFLGGLVLGEGTGSTVSALPDIEKQYLVVITPNTGVSTASAYAALKAPSLTTPGSDSILARSFAGSVSGSCDQWALHNDFEGVIFEIEPEIKRAKMALFEAGARGGLLAGSGSSVFGIFADEDSRERALVDLRSETEWRVFPCETVSRAEYFHAIGSSGFPLLRSLNLQPDTGA
jgi:4-diphosphocytidyl-2-C-methyl-D-erythritol kinase